MPIARHDYQPPELAIRRLEGRTLYTHVVAIEGGGRQIYVSGQLSRDSEGRIVGEGDMAAQIDQVGRNLEACLRAAGASLRDLVRTTTYVTDIDEFFRHSEARMRWFGPALPTSTTVEVRRLSHPALLVEVEALAVVA